MAFQAHARSISLPSRLNPGSIKVEEGLNKLKSLDNSSSSVSSINARLIGLDELYASFNELIQSHSTKQALGNESRLVEDALESSVPLINACSTTRDIVASLKSHARDLQSALRRRKSSGCSSTIDSHVASYIAFRKNSKKEIAKCLRELKMTNAFAPVLDAELHLAMVIRVLREIFSIAINIFQSLLVFLSPPIVKPKCKTSAKWLLISRLVTKGSAGSSRCGYEKMLKEVAGADVALFSLQSRRSDVATDFEDVQRKLRVLDSGSQDLESALDSLFRCLVQNRVSLLNVLTTH